MARASNLERLPAFSAFEQQRDDAQRRHADGIADPTRPYGNAAHVGEGERLDYGAANMVNANVAVTVYAPIPKQEDASRVILIVRNAGSAVITVALSGATVDGAATFSLTSPVESAALMATGDRTWVEV